MTDSPFVRSGAVVRCTACEHKYRIKSSHVERLLTTGPRTLDEADSVLRSDSVDIDPDELAPVKIDDDGNVVGLSGLSELMRQSDARGAKAKVQSRLDHEPDTDDALPPAAIVRAKEAPAGKTSSAQERARTLARKRKMRTNAIVIAALACLLVVSGVVLIMMSSGGDPEPGSGADVSTPPPADQPDAASTPIDMFRGGGSSDGNDQTTDDPTPPADAPFAEVGPPSPNPEVLYQPRGPQADPDAPPADVPTVLIPAVPVEHEGWYVMTPPRGTAEAGGESDIELNELMPSPIEGGQTLLTGSITNRAGRAVLQGEAHVLLLDSAGRVFAETYMPVALVESGGVQPVALVIPTRYWQRARGVRASVEVQAWADTLSPMPGVVLDAVGQGRHTAVRISAKHTGETALRGMMLMMLAEDGAGRPVARFLVDEPSLYLEPGAWLDLVVATPVGGSAGPLRWSATLQPR